MKYILLFIILALSINISAQRKIKLIRADKLSPATYNGKKVQKLSGKVIFKHEATTMHCDSAFFYDSENSLDAFGNIYINDNDSVHIYGDTLNYSGNTKLAELHSNVRLRDQKMTLTTEHLRYNLKTKVAYYYTGGKIIDTDNTLTSRLGHYYSQEKTIYFQHNVILVNPNYTMHSDTLIYNTRSKTSYFHGPTNIISEENSIYCENGWYNTDNNTSRYQKNTVLRNKAQELFADSLYYDRDLGYGQAFINVKLIDTVKNIVVSGHYAEYFENGGSTIFADSSLAIIIDEENDSLFMHADTLRIEFDSSNQAKSFYAFNRVKFFRSDIQGKCDSLVYHMQDSIMIMYNEPLIWGSNSQLSGMKIRALITNSKLDKIYIDTNAFVLQHDSLKYYNQVAGKNMLAHFKDDKIDKVDVFGNSQSVYFTRDEDKELIGVNLGSSSDMRVEFNDDGVSNIIYLNKPTASLNPVARVSKRALYLRGFKSYEHWRPKNKDEIFIWEPAKL